MNDLKLFLVRRKPTGWCEDYSMVVIAKDALHAERAARMKSDNFRKDKKVEVQEIDTTREDVILVANTGA